MTSGVPEGNRRNAVDFRIRLILGLNEAQWILGDPRQAAPLEGVKKIPEGASGKAYLPPGNASRSTGGNSAKRS